MRILLASTPFAGHLIPLLGLARALQDRGHKVTVHTGSKYAGMVRAAGVEHLPWSAAQDFDDADPAATFPSLAAARGPGALVASFRDLFYGTAPGQARDMLAAHEVSPFDVVAAEGTCFGAELLHELTGLPYATASLSPLALPSRRRPPPGLPLAPGRGPLGRARDAVLRGAVEHTVNAAFRRLHDRARNEMGLGPVPHGGLENAWSRELVLAQGVAGLEPPRPDLPARVHFVGDLAAGTRIQEPAPEWIGQLDASRPVVHVSEGTLGADERSLVGAVVEALTGQGMQLVVGGAHQAGALPPWVIEAATVPHDQLLPRTDLFVTNGGYGGMIAALSNGVPILAVPSTAEKSVGAGNVAASGAGRRLREKQATPERLRTEIRRMLEVPRHRDRAAELATEIAEAGGPRRGAELVERLADEARTV